MAKIGIVCDDYKVEMFKRELDAAGVIWSIDDKAKVPKKFVVIKCISEQHIVKPIVDKVTQYWIDYYNDYYKRRKNN